MHDVGAFGGAAPDSSGVAAAFAHAWDAGDTASIARLLAPECECRDGEVRVRGPEAIAALDRAARRWLEQGFDDVRHDSAVERATPSEAVIGVTTTLMRMPGRWHRLRHSCTLLLAEGRIVGLVHGCDAAAASAFRAFVEACGAPPPPPGFGV